MTDAEKLVVAESTIVSLREALAKAEKERGESDAADAAHDGLLPLYSAAVDAVNDAHDVLEFLSKRLTISVSAIDQDKADLSAKTVRRTFVNWRHRIATVLSASKRDRKDVMGTPGVRDSENPCVDYKPGNPDDFAQCETDGHYLCGTCKNRKLTEEKKT